MDEISILASFNYANFMIGSKRFIQSAVGSTDNMWHLKSTMDSGICMIVDSQGNIKIRYLCSTCL